MKKRKKTTKKPETLIGQKITLPNRSSVWVAKLPEGGWYVKFTRFDGEISIVSHLKLTEEAFDALWVCAQNCIANSTY